MKKAEKQFDISKPWIHRRHRILVGLLRRPFAAFLKLKIGLQADRFTGPEDEPYLILFNHQTPYDQFFPSISFHFHVYYLATEDIFSNGFISSLLRWSVAPIPIKKQTNDRNAIRLMLKVVKEGGSIAIAPEGNRTYSGKTEYMNPSIAHMAKLIHLPIVLYRIEGGYGTVPRWSDTVRKGGIHAYPYRVIRPEEYDSMSKDELFEEIRKGLDVNEAAAEGSYRSARKAEFIERMVYVCPYCGLTEFRSRGDETECLKCHRKMRYHEDKHISGVGYGLPFSFANDWYEYQKDFINHLDLSEYCKSPMFTDRAKISEVIVYKKKETLRKEASLKLYGDRIVIDEGTPKEWVLPFDEITGAAVLGRNKLNIYHDGRIYQFRGEKFFNALKYVNIYYRYKNMKSGDGHGEFLGL